MLKRLFLCATFCAWPALAACPTSWSNGYAYCRMLTVDHTQVAAALSNFTVTVSISVPSARVQNANCYDCIFTTDNAGTTLLKWETESYAAGTLAAHILMTSLSNSSDTQFYIFYGKAGIVSFQGGAAGSAWDANYVAIQHLSALPSTAVDSISGASATIANVTAATGEIDGAGSFNGTSGSIDMGNGTALRFSGDFTLSAWFNSASSAYQVILGKQTASNAYEWIFGINAHSAGTVELWDETSLNYAHAPYTGSVWQHVVCLRASGTMNCYINGTAGTSAPSTTNFAAVAGYNDLYIGQRQYTGAEEWFNGTIDEIRISNVARAVSWITTEYNNQKPGSTFVSLGSEVSLAHKVSHRVTAN
jgi:hypothetical protein